MIKKELQKSILAVSEEENANLNKDVKILKSLNEGISLVQKDENLLKGANKKIISIVESKAISLKYLEKRMNFLAAFV